ncbi:MAG: Cysteine desulfurase [Candidatus Kaiserbacteria bacterium GW2011_GWC2_49_12]|uniref:Cysteine desulfurase n=4 Tax=Candidatus Kaiseribacteriota TaxID=1752734 RepID=A0A0G1WDQ3_9BACT|nr:MAG: Cysteine desulfurase [Candidatus Kaiserbacteria bacterium GW2011_GWC2_49_12]KKW16893.1 MAG: Cysteine desulfurase [Candidatus Kaiserbacteria bacterium GW2011_GWB1_50_17]KKW18283.1 MAG: Cysteine desulfurase [Candidatus Kaiserbacteria bacterium GW2011_GWA1_50_28]HCM44004.1 cysteine desulfurase NifS [Candidatus Kaiserbacteria bacterium]
MGMFRKRRIYLDYASAPPVLPEALRAMREAEHLIGNPGAIHEEGVAMRAKLEDARARIAALLGIKAREIVFTSGLTESNNLAILGFARKLLLSGGNLDDTHWIVSAIEHDSVLECFAEIERLGGSVSHANPDMYGSIKPQEIVRLLRKETVLVSVGWANNEIGTIQPLTKIAHILRAYEKEQGTIVALHADAGQAPLYLPTIVNSLGVDLLSFGANKLYGPHGIGALYIGSRMLAGGIAPIIMGGAQEKGIRAGTESVTLAAGFAAAFEVVARERDAEAKRLSELRDTLVRELSAGIPDLVINGDLKHALPHMLNISIPNISSEYIVLALDREGIAISTKSACREGEQASHVVAELGGESWRAKNTLRFSLGKETAQSDVERTAQALRQTVVDFQTRS